MSGPNLLDVLHYYFEEDLTHSSELHANSRTVTRENIYKNLYDTEYKYGYLNNVGTNDTNNNVVKLDNASGVSIPLEFDTEPEDNLSDIKPFNPKRKEVKPYVPPTQFDGTAEIPFGNILDAPMN
jgi:hypothetical protein